MAHAFAPISAKPAFGTLKESLNQSDYLNRKKAKIVYCRTPSYCNKIKTSDSYEFINTYKLGRYARSLETCNIIPINKGNLIMGQYAKLNYNNVCTVSKITPPDIGYTEETTSNNIDTNDTVYVDNCSNTQSNDDDNDDDNDNDNDDDNDNTCNDVILCKCDYGNNPQCNPCVIINTEDKCSPFYYDNIIDPLGELFGASQCGEMNYTRYMVFYPPTAPLTINTI